MCVRRLRALHRSLGTVGGGEVWALPWSCPEAAVARISTAVTGQYHGGTGGTWRAGARRGH